jgi:hypothetical protein
MKAEDLRIGNWINEFGIPRQTKPLDIVGLRQIEQASKICIDLTPIPLTEEWLLKFGFEKINHRTEGIIYQNKWLRFTETFYADWRGGAIGKIQYVHQLQNLYFALTGNELTIR